MRSAALLLGLVACTPAVTPTAHFTTVKGAANANSHSVALHALLLSGAGVDVEQTEDGLLTTPWVTYTVKSDAVVNSIERMTARVVIATYGGNMSVAVDCHRDQPNGTSAGCAGNVPEPTAAIATKLAELIDEMATTAINTAGCPAGPAATVP
jgi:hypothetical protein